MLRDNKSVIPLSRREMDIMDILWNTGKPLIASDISKKGDTISINTVQSTLKSLMSKDLIEVADIIYSGTVLSRSYRPKLSRDGYALRELRRYFQQNVDKDISTLAIIGTLLEHEKDEETVIDELEEMLMKRKEELNEKDKGG